MDLRYSHPQTGGKHIGPQPDIKLIFEKYFNDTDPCNGGCKLLCFLGECSCDTNNDCNNDEFCNENNKCEQSPCLPVCNEWESCNEEIICILKENRCNLNSDCDQYSICNDEHFCKQKPLCGGILCNNLESCNENQRCECTSNYYRDEKIDKCVEKPKCGDDYCNDNQKCSNDKCISKSSSCTYNQNSSFPIFFLFFFLFFILIIRKRDFK